MLTGTPSTQGHELRGAFYTQGYTISHLTLREWRGAAYYMAGKSSMTSFAMSCKCSKTSKVPCHMVVS